MSLEVGGLGERSATNFTYRPWSSILESWSFWVEAFLRLQFVVIELLNRGLMTNQIDSTHIR